MSDNQTVDLQPDEKHDVATSSAWDESLTHGNRLRRLGPFALAPAVAAMFGSLSNATTDEAQLWAREQNRSATTIVYEIETARGRAVSRAEAIRIAHGILNRAERERLTLAENEARRGIQWEDE